MNVRAPSESPAGWLQSPLERSFAMRKGFSPHQLLDDELLACAGHFGVYGLDRSLPGDCFPCGVWLEISPFALCRILLF